MKTMWTEDIVALQHADGSWGHFHSLGAPTRQNPLTTEQALRRLLVLGMTQQDAPMQRALAYLHGVLAQQITPPDRREGVLNWDYFEAMMAATWIKLLSPQDTEAAKVAAFWADIITEATVDGCFAEDDRYRQAYRSRIPRLSGREREIGAAQFYMVNLLWGMLPPAVERAYVAYLLGHETGIYYVYGHRLDAVPARFDTCEASHYLAALECLSGYASAREALRFAVDWIMANRQPDGTWDLGPAAKDGIYLPLSGAWRTAQARQRDCTARVRRVLEKLG